MYGTVPWNKGLTKETSKIIAKCANNRRGKQLGFSNGHSHSDETKQKISKAHVGKKLSNETKQKLRDINKGKTLSAETRNKMSKARRGIVQQLVTCPHCGKKGGYSSMCRWHFDNCKLLRV